MDTLKAFIDGLADQAEKRGYHGSILINEAHYRKYMALARADGALHPADGLTVTVDGYGYMAPRPLKKKGLYQIRYHRTKTLAETEAEMALELEQRKGLIEKRKMEAERTEAVLHYSRTGDATKLEEYAKRYGLDKDDTTTAATN